MNWKKLGKAVLFPHVAIMILLLPLATALLVYSMVFVGTESALAIISYVIAAYTLTVWCARIPWLISAVKRFKEDNRYAERWLSDERLRVKTSLYGTLLWNIAYAALHFRLGYQHRTFWFYSLAAYYLSLAAMRLFLVQHTRKFAPGERMRKELAKYRACGWIFLIMNLALSLMIFFMVYWNRTFRYHQIVTIALAAYTFTSLTVAIVNLVRYRKYNSPVYSASKAISLASASVSMLTLESAMLTAFGDGTLTRSEQRWLLGATGAAVSILVVMMAISMIVRGSKKLKEIKEKEKESANG